MYIFVYISCEFRYTWAYLVFVTHLRLTHLIYPSDWCVCVLLEDVSLSDRRFDSTPVVLYGGKGCSMEFA